MMLRRVVEMLFTMASISGLFAGCNADGGPPSPPRARKFPELAGGPPSASPPVFYSSQTGMLPEGHPIESDNHVPNLAAAVDRKGHATSVLDQLGLTSSGANYEQEEAAYHLFELMRRSEIFACGTITDISAVGVDKQAIAHYQPSVFVHRMSQAVPPEFTYNSQSSAAPPAETGLSFCAFFIQASATVMTDAHSFFRVTSAGKLVIPPLDPSPASLSNLAQAAFSTMPTVSWEG